jgi:o-succinylbenzoate---CoA ligase
MVSDYPYENIVINHREVLIQNIVDETVHPESDFERHTFEFIRAWFLGQEKFILHTSGSTGDPKSVILLRHQLISSAELSAEALNLRSGEIALVCLDTRYIAGKMMLVRCFVTGMQIVATEPGANPFSNLPATIRPDFAAFVPYQVYHILGSDERYSMMAIRNVIIGGAPMSHDAAVALSHFPFSVYVTYGMTETISHIALQRLGQSNTGIFTALPGVTLSADERGCLVIDAPYLNEKQTTNDLVQMVDAKAFRWLGRLDNVINSGGVKISPESIERALESAFSKINLHHRFVVSSVPDAFLGDKIVLVIESSDIDEPLKKTLFKQMEQTLQSYSRPKKILVLPKFPETNTGKIHRLGIRKIISEQQQN